MPCEITLVMGMREMTMSSWLMHYAKGSESKKHSYVSRKMGKNGKWIYTYRDDSTVVDKVTGKMNEVKDDFEENGGEAGEAFGKIRDLWNNPIGSGYFDRAAAVGKYWSGEEMTDEDWDNYAQATNPSHFGTRDKSDLERIADPGTRLYSRLEEDKQKKKKMLAKKK